MHDFYFFIPTSLLVPGEIFQVVTGVGDSSLLSSKLIILISNRREFVDCRQEVTGYASN